MSERKLVIGVVREQNFGDHAEFITKHIEPLPEETVDALLDRAFNLTSRWTAPLAPGDHVRIDFLYGNDNTAQDGIHNEVLDSASSDEGPPF